MTGQEMRVGDDGIARRWPCDYGHTEGDHESAGACVRPAPARVPDNDGLREAMQVALHRHESGAGWDGCPACKARVEVLLSGRLASLIAERDQAVAQVERVRALLSRYQRGDSVSMSRLRRALDGAP